MINALVSAVFTAALLPGASQPSVRATMPPSMLMQVSTESLAYSQVKATDVQSKGNTNTSSSDDLFAGTEKFAQGASGSTEVNLDPDSMGMVGAKNSTGDLAKKVKKMVIRSYTYDKPGMYKMEDIDIYRNKLEDGSWKCSVRVREKNESTDICSRLAADHQTRETVIITTQPKQVTFIEMTGNLSLADLGKAGGAVGRTGGAAGRATGSMGRAEDGVGQK